MPSQQGAASKSGLQTLMGKRDFLSENRSSEVPNCKVDFSLKRKNYFV